MVATQLIRTMKPVFSPLPARVLLSEALDMEIPGSEGNGGSAQQVLIDQVLIPFLVAAALKDAQRTIEDAQIIRLAVDDQQRFADLLLDPPPLAPAMQRARQARQRLIVDSQ